ncbi:hypothetical protein ACIGXM_14945 [Kitasatospora sp. NPDC052896]
MRSSNERRRTLSTSRSPSAKRTSSTSPPNTITAEVVDHTDGVTSWGINS